MSSYFGSMPNQRFVVPHQQETRRKSCSGSVFHFACSSSRPRFVHAGLDCSQLKSAIIGRPANFCTEPFIGVIWRTSAGNEVYGGDRLQERISEKLDGELRMRHIFRANEIVELLRGKITQFERGFPKAEML